MTGARDVVHQIEYRQYASGQAFNLVASTLPPESRFLRDSRIRAMAYPPAVDGLRQSLRYQVYPGGSAVLAWRYADWKVTDHEGSREQPPRIARVLVGPPRLLTPEVAIALYRGGLPEGLWQVVAAALSDPDLPLAIYLGNSHMFRSRRSLHIPLLWGLRRVVSPVFGGGGRGWSFSTSEPFQSNADPATLPGIVFRPAQDARPTGPAARQEIASHPFSPGERDGEGIHAELAGRLVAEYRKQGGDEFRRLVVSWCGTEQRPAARLRKVTGSPDISAATRFSETPTRFPAAPTSSRRSRTRSGPATCSSH